MRILRAFLCLVIFIAAPLGASAAPATFDDLGPIQPAEADAVSRTLNSLYLDALSTVNAPLWWKDAEVGRTRENLRRAGSSPAHRDARWLASARRFVAAYADEQARLARLSSTTPSEIVCYPGEKAGWELPDRTLVMTFDDGPDPRTTPRIQATLRAARVPAIFFVLGKNLGARKPGAGGGYDGFTVGSHTWSHAFLAGASRDVVMRELENTNARIKSVGLPAPSLFRPPYGAIRPRELTMAQSLGLHSILWNVDSQDWDAAMHRRGRIASRVVALALLRRHGVVLCHDIQSATADDLASLLASLRSLGFRFEQPYR